MRVTEALGSRDLGDKLTYANEINFAGGICCYFVSSEAKGSPEQKAKGIWGFPFVCVHVCRAAGAKEKRRKGEKGYRYVLERKQNL